MCYACVMRTCTKCKKTFPASKEHFYSQKGSRDGLTPRCKSCVNEDNKAYERKKREEDPVAWKKKENARQQAWYHKNIDRSRAYARKQAAKERADPDKRARINMRGRASSIGFTCEEFEAMLTAQGGACAICFTTEPSQHTGSRGWNLDHCHRTRKVRFILCGPCNRGLGAFRDDPARMRRAADLLDV